MPTYPPGYYIRGRVDSIANVPSLFPPLLDMMLGQSLPGGPGPGGVQKVRSLNSAPASSHRRRRRRLRDRV